MAYPKDFVWGAATASYQIEGSDLKDGRGECIWYRFSHTPGKVFDGDTGDVACDHYHRYREDVALMRDIGLRAYRFSVSWPRVIPRGTGATNPAGLDFYDRLVDELLAAQIVPYVTLYHWDLPQALQDQGGWANPDIVAWFADYADLMSRRLGDRVKHWITLNEPYVIAMIGNLEGDHAPGICDLPTALRVTHYLSLAHGAAVPLIRQNVPAAQVGTTLNLAPTHPASESEADIRAARRDDGILNRWFLDPVFKGTYPADMVAYYGAALAGIDLDSVRAAAVPIDFLGINYYMRNVVAARQDDTILLKWPPPEGAELTAMDWEVYPDGLTEILERVHRDYAPAAIYVTENGAAFDDPAPAGGVVEDPRRVAYLEAHFRAAEAALDRGVPLKGYFVWSLLDNFEWGYGYSKRFGIVHVDYATQQRTMKRSALFYRDWLRGMA